MSSKLGVGRNTVREAVRSLVRMGKLEARQGDGTYVRSRSGVGAAFARTLRHRELLEAIAPYAAGKGGINHLVRTLAAEWAEHRIRVIAATRRCPASAAPVLDCAKTPDRQSPTAGPLRPLMRREPRDGAASKAGSASPWHDGS
ncbi:SDR family NAD(P)-dependent oxidoreductase [Streptomyces acidicola]|uniref:SDR family NAD(P)-dependent oxidoreductase n=1 Tax=Streptomyces acidicola TaxID=2596892 RepID=UPI003797EB3D